MSPKTTCRATARVKLSVIPRGTDRQLRINLGVGSLFVSNKMRRMGGVKVGYLAQAREAITPGSAPNLGLPAQAGIPWVLLLVLWSHHVSAPKSYCIPFS